MSATLTRDALWAGAAWDRSPKALEPLGPTGQAPGHLQQAGNSRIGTPVEDALGHPPVQYQPSLLQGRQLLRHVGLGLIEERREMADTLLIFGQHLEHSDAERVGQRL